ncbi:Pentatricopeptide repeat-containing protein [Thalictrum thalictroides]|uniref:Pentatricopeptide repeat-containing protein n=1 Tax=Thalictrum thalictroides TaxID=46969 RepID=A0A7J6VS90_THATH|nr:Pentatricopeptide repeat-containing protein [Thalictrum thalictroides]
MKWPNGIAIGIGSSTSPHTSLSHHYRSLIRACTRQTNSQTLEQGQKLHATLFKNGLAASPASFLNNALLHFYATFDFPFCAHKVFDEIPKSYVDTVDWTTLMSCYVRNCLPREALSIFSFMREEGVEPDEVTFVSLFAACSRLGKVMIGEQGHVYMIKKGLPFIVTVSNAAMDMYVKCGKMEDARRLFDEISERSVVSWSVMLSGVIRWEGIQNGRYWFDQMPIRNEVAWTLMVVAYIQNGFTRDAFSLICNMIWSMYYFGLSYVTLCSFLSACSQSGDLIVGKWVHAYAMRAMGKELHVMVGTALIDMYSKCGRIEAACKVFENLSYRNVVAWNAILSGLAMHGRGKCVLEHFNWMVTEVEPDDITFVSVLSACNHSGLVHQGYRYFKDLGPRYGITPKIEHYACMVDLLGRAGRLKEAEVVVMEMPIPPNEFVLGSLLAACGLHGKLPLGEHILQELIQIDPLNTEYHVLLSNMYTLAGRQKEADSLRQVLKSRGITKVPGMSSIHVDGQVHHFSSGDKSHPRTQDVYFMLDEMISN